MGSEYSPSSSDKQFTFDIENETVTAYFEVENGITEQESIDSRDSFIISGVPGNVLANEPTQLAGRALNPRGVTVKSVYFDSSAKIKFLQGSKFRPWIIPAGLAIHVISPPSESITYVNPGIMFAGVLNITSGKISI